ncbi:MAG TPA: cupin domain-containing protein [Polyangiaceae bacterium]|nr:cupin domain-containing protein [Polyangiaceae bacterium]
MADSKLCISEREVTERTDRGGTYRVMITPGSVNAKQLILGKATVPPGERVKAHVHDYSEEAFFVVQGTGCAILDGIGTVEFRAGDAVLVPKGVTHSIENRGSEEVVVVFASAPLAPRPESGHRNLEKGS